MQLQSALGSQLANTLMAIMRAVANESKDGPRLFTIEPLDGNWYHPMTARYRLALLCEAEKCRQEFLEAGKGIYEFDASRDWVKRIAPYANLVASVLRTLLPILGPTINVAFGQKTTETWNIKDHLDLMRIATGNLIGELDISDPSRLRQGMLSDEERSGILALHALLREVDPHHEKLGLRRMPTYTGDYLWLCQTHYAQMQPKIPDRI